MNSLEFIDREISSTEIDLWYSKRLLIENPPNEELKKEMLEVKINVLERNMKCLQQIKSELEAWYVVKEKAEVIEVVTTFMDSSHAKETTPTFRNSEPVEIKISIIGPDKIRTFKKALEVEENDNR